MDRRGWISGGLIALAALAPDRLTKAWVRAGGAEGGWPGVFRFRRVTNTGAAFSMLRGRTLILTVGTALLLALIVGLLARFGDRLSRTSRAGLWLVIGGGLSNCFDRVFYGGVLDFIEPLFVRFAVFNVADICIVAGAFLAALGMLAEGRGKDGGA